MVGLSCLAAMMGVVLRRALLALAVAVVLGATVVSGAASGGVSLPISHVSSVVVQPQPPPGSCHATGSAKFSGPDLGCTPGARNPAVKQSTIDTTICVSGYSKTVRPAVRITRAEKAASMAAYGDRGPASGFEYDHLVSLELGGAPNDPRNLWPEPGGIPNPKDRVENRLHRDLCAHKISLIAAQRELAKRWVATYHDLFG
jgi:hypothetical protein